jgi:hypothetical protein
MENEKMGRYNEIKMPATSKPITIKSAGSMRETRAPNFKVTSSS